MQDLPPKVLQLLLYLTTEQVFFAGDTAQSIAKGVGAKFGDLASVLKNLDSGVPKVIQLT